MVAEKIMLTSNSKFRHRPGWQANLTVKRNFKFRVNINFSATIRVTLYSYVFLSAQLNKTECSSGRVKSKVHIF